MEAPIVVLDACVLYPAALRDLFMRLAVAGLIQAKWTALIHEEWIKAVLEDRADLKRGDLERTRRLMDHHAEGCLVRDFESHIGSFGLPDPDDEHVLAAAVVSAADSIVTWNGRDFPTRTGSGNEFRLLNRRRWTEDRASPARLGLVGWGHATFRDKTHPPPSNETVIPPPPTPNLRLPGNWVSETGWGTDVLDPSAGKEDIALQR